MRFIETPVFTRAVKVLVPDEDYRAMQLALMLRPEQGALIQGSGGRRKIRSGGSGSWKSGDIRVVYYWDKAHESFYTLLAYAKNEQEDLTPDRLRILSRLVREEFK